MIDPIWTCEVGEGPLVATAIHDGGAVRESLRPHFHLSQAARLREEDPFTGRWTAAAPTRIVGTRSRFEVDLNRPREKAVYLYPEDAWGLKVWKDDLPEDELNTSLAEYDAFYGFVENLLANIEATYHRFLVLDIHSYNHLRDGADGPLADPLGNPEVNIGTGTMDRELWAPVVDAFTDALRSFDFPDGRLDVRENVKFFGGNFPRWIHQRFPQTGCAIAIEFKKTFMNEWTGEPDLAHIDAIARALEHAAKAAAGALESLGR